MRVEQVVLRWQGHAGTCVAVALTLFLGVACEHLRTASPPVARAVTLDTSAELSVVMSRLGGQARRTVSGAESVQLGIHFDPEMIDVEKVATYVLWGRSAESSEWKRIKEIPASDLPASLSFREGTVGLRASARYQDGEEVLIPGTGDEPVLWLVVDRSPPSLSWLAPVQNAPVKTGEPVDLVWTINEVEIGLEPSELEWSTDGGRTWTPVATVEPQSGHQSHLWKVPPGLVGPCLVRVTARDLVGHVNSSVLTVEFVSDVPVGALARGPSGASSSSEATVVPGVASQPGEPSPSSGPASGTGASGGKAFPGSLAPPDGPLTIEPMATTLLGGGKSFEVRWRSKGLSPEQGIKAEWSRDGGKTWQLAGTSPASAGALNWEVPCVDVSGCLLRVRTDSADRQEHVSVGPRPFGIDCSPPRVSMGNVPDVVGRSARFDLRWDDGEGSGLKEVSVFLRGGGGATVAAGLWRSIPDSTVKLDQDRASPGKALLTLDLGSVNEGAYEIHLAAVDRVGNRTEAPDGGAAAMGAFTLDKTPPRLLLTPYPLPWVEGMMADIQIDADWRDVELPVILFGRGSRTLESGVAGSAGWQELARWTRRPPNTQQFSWSVPTGFRELSVKIQVTDRAGNSSSEVISSRRVEPAIYLKEFTRGTVVDGGSTRRVLWELHSAAVGHADELRVQVEYQPGAGRMWEPICQSLTVLQKCMWEVPRGDGSGEHRIRLRLERGGKLVSEYQSDPFVIRGGSPTFQEPLIAQDSMMYFDIARKFVEKYIELRRELAQTGKTVTPEAQDRLDALVQHAKESFGKALELAENNYHAAYAYAQFLNRLPERDDRQVEKLLRQVIQFKPTHHWAYNDLGALCIKEQRYQEAVVALDAAAKLEPSADVHYNLGLALFHERKMPDARSQFQAALTSPQQGRVHHGVLYYYMIHTYLQEGHTNQAQALYQKEAAKIPAELRERLRKVFEA